MVNRDCQVCGRNKATFIRVLNNEEAFIRLYCLECINQIKGELNPSDSKDGDASFSNASEGEQ